LHAYEGTRPLLCGPDRRTPPAAASKSLTFLVPSLLPPAARGWRPAATGQQKDGAANTLFSVACLLACRTARALSCWMHSSSSPSQALSSSFGDFRGPQHAPARARRSMTHDAQSVAVQGTGRTETTNILLARPSSTWPVSDGGEYLRTAGWASPLVRARTKKVAAQQAKQPQTKQGETP
jgi:hypothetical protein